VTPPNRKKQKVAQRDFMKIFTKTDVELLKNTMLQYQLYGWEKIGCSKRHFFHALLLLITSLQYTEYSLCHCQRDIRFIISEKTNTKGENRAKTM
jgi:hypothetical protein